VSLSNYQKANDKNRNIISKLPENGYTMRTMAREFKFAEDLLVFLSQRKEEASISYVSVLPNLKVLSYGTSNINAIAPKTSTIYLGGLFLGFLIPFGVLYLLKILDTKINTREDLEKGLPRISILGEVPFDENYSSENDDRGIIAESTRVIRSSMSFLLNQNKPQVIIATSTIKGEGKSFVSYNIAQSYNALGKKVILIGADLRNPQVHSLLGIERGNLGLSTFLNDVNYNDLEKLIVKGKSIDEIDYLLSGAIPPNPSELLMRPRMKELLEILKSSYDLIIIDTAPLLLVSDTTPLLPLCDLVVYVSRAQYSDKNIFPFIKDIHSRENMPPFGMVLNGLIASASSSGYGYGYRYSYKYRYSYTYKYNYGYGYGYGRDED
jgi:capsular exopolysaccharide synthesis family protein